METTKKNLEKVCLDTSKNVDLINLRFDIYELCNASNNVLSALNFQEIDHENAQHYIKKLSELIKKKDFDQYIVK